MRKDAALGRRNDNSTRIDLPRLLVFDLDFRLFDIETPIKQRFFLGRYLLLSRLEEPAAINETAQNVRLRQHRLAIQSFVECSLCDFERRSAITGRGRRTIAGASFLRRLVGETSTEQRYSARYRNLYSHR